MRQRDPLPGLLEGVDRLAAVAEAGPPADPALGSAVMRELPSRPAHLPAGRVMVIVVEGKAVAVRTIHRAGRAERDPAESAASIARTLAAVDAVLEEDALQSGAAGALTESEQAVLRESGADVAGATAADDPVLQSIAAYARLVATSLDVEQAARRLRVQPSRIRQRLGGAAPTLYGFKLKGSWRVPVVQFTRKGTVPGLEAVIPALPKDLHPLEVVGWFTEPQPDLEADTDPAPLSPREWLSLGRPTEVVAGLARELAHAS
jgi:hypothetical protein